MGTEKVYQYTRLNKDTNETTQLRTWANRKYIESIGCIPIEASEREIDASGIDSQGICKVSNPCAI